MASIDQPVWERTRSGPVVQPTTLPDPAGLATGRGQREFAQPNKILAAHPSVSIIVPTYNEERRLERCLEELHRHVFKQLGDDFEVIIVDDGSKDETVETARAQVGRFSRSQLLRLPWHTGKGAAVRLGVAAARGEAIVFMDADLATDLATLTAVLEALRNADVAVGSRAISGAVVTGHSRTRAVLHRTFRSHVRRLTGVSASDPQCGFKAFRSDVAKALFAMGRVDGFAFDVEILLLAQKLRHRIVEVPVRWHAVSGSHIRLVRDTLAILRDSVRVRLRYLRRSPLPRPTIAPSYSRVTNRQLTR